MAGVHCALAGWVTTHERHASWSRSRCAVFAWSQLFPCCPAKLGCSGSGLPAALLSPSSKGLWVRCRGAAQPTRAMAKQLHFNKNGEALKRMQAGVDKLASVVGVTLGPKVRAAFGKPGASQPSLPLPLECFCSMQTASWVPVEPWHFVAWRPSARGK